MSNANNQQYTILKYTNQHRFVGLKWDESIVL